MIAYLKCKYNIFKNRCLKQLVQYGFIKGATLLYEEYFMLNQISILIIIF